MPRPTIDLDGSLDNADWTKQVWDLVGIDDIDKLRAYLKANKMSPAQFKRLPVYRFNVKKMPWLREL